MLSTIVRTLVTSNKNKKRFIEKENHDKECKEKLFQNIIYGKLGEGVYGEVTECGPRVEKRQLRSTKSRRIDDRPLDKCERFALKKIAKKRTFENEEYEYPKRDWVNEYGKLIYLHDTLRIKSVPFVYDYWECPDYYYIKMQLLNALSLYDILTKLNEGIDIVNEPRDSNIDIIEKLYAFLKDVYTMNEASVYNNDLHTNNILWERDEEKFYMIDFGMSTFGEYYQHEKNREIITDENKKHADVIYILAQLPEDIQQDIIRIDKQQGGSYKKKKRIIKINKKTPKKILKKKTYKKLN